MLDKEIYLNHINDNEVAYKLKRLLDMVQSVIKNHKTVVSDFMDPYERSVSESILNRFQEISFHYEGGSKESERKCIVIYPQYIYKTDVKEQIGFIKIDGHMEGLTHKDFLGAVLGLGITRDKIGDILIYNEYVVMIVKKELMDFIILNFEKAGKANLKISEIQGDTLEYPLPDFIEYRKFASSLRLDVFLSAAYNVSRSVSSSLINSGDIKVNWEKTTKPDKLIEPGDVVSARGKGRTILHGIDGVSKKGRYNLIIRKLI